MHILPFYFVGKISFCCSGCLEFASKQPPQHTFLPQVKKQTYNFSSCFSGFLFVFLVCAPWALEFFSWRGGGAIKEKSQATDPTWKVCPPIKQACFFGRLKVKFSNESVILLLLVLKFILLFVLSEEAITDWMRLAEKGIMVIGKCELQWILEYLVT